MNLLRVTSDPGIAKPIRFTTSQNMQCASVHECTDVTILIWVRFFFSFFFFFFFFLFFLFPLFFF